MLFLSYFYEVQNFNQTIKVERIIIASRKKNNCNNIEKFGDVIFI